MPTLPPSDSRAPMRSWYLPGGTWMRRTTRNAPCADELVGLRLEREADDVARAVLDLAVRVRGEQRDLEVVGEQPLRASA